MAQQQPQPSAAVDPEYLIVTVDVDHFTKNKRLEKLTGNPYVCRTCGLNIVKLLARRGVSIDLDSETVVIGSLPSFAKAEQKHKLKDEERAHMARLLDQHRASGHNDFVRTRFTAEIRKASELNPNDFILSGREADLTSFNLKEQDLMYSGW